MTDSLSGGTRQVPPRALILSLAALAVPVAGVLFFPDELGNYEVLLWLLALVPAFLLAYYRGWSGAAAALALGMAALAVAQTVAVTFDRELPDWSLLFGVIGAFIIVTLGVGWLASQMNRDRQKAEQLALTDALTTLPNRRHARVVLENEFGAAQRGRRLAVVLFDVDHFKDYNDQYGHAAGDTALRCVGKVLVRETRRMDLSARYGGEEFLSILSGADEEGTLSFVERVRERLRQTRFPAAPVTFSAGVACYQEDMNTPDDLLEAADEALYQAKSDGRDCVRVYRWTIPV